MRIFLDVDGVLADFIGSALRLHGKRPEEVLACWPKGEWDAYKVLGLGSEAAFWSPIMNERYFWDDLEVLPWANAVIRMVQKYDPDFMFLTKPSKCASCYGGKRNWISRLGFEPSEKLCVDPRKCDRADAGRVLIDDCEANIDQWNDLGGTGILFPQPWNSKGHIENRLNYLKRELEKL